MRNRKIVWLTERRENSRLHLQLIKDMARIHINGGKFFTNILAPHVSLITVFVTDSGFIRKTIHKQRGLEEGGNQTWKGLCNDLRVMNKNHGVRLANAGAVYPTELDNQGKQPHSFLLGAADTQEETHRKTLTLFSW